MIEKEVTQITEELIKYQTQHKDLKTFEKPKQVKKCLNYIENYFSNTNVHIECFGEKNNNLNGDSYAEVFYENPKPSMIISTEKTKTPDYLLHGHIDVVTPDPENYAARQGKYKTKKEKIEEHFNPVIKDGKMYGRGTADMKLGVACLMKTMKDIINQKSTETPSIALMIVTDEEQGGFRGAGYHFKDRNYNPGFTISAEPSDHSQKGFMIVYKQKGVLQLDITSKGKASHSSRPWEGQNANKKLIQLLTQLEEKFPNYSENDQWKTTFNISNIQTDKVARNMVPSKATAQIDIRYTKEYAPKQILKDIAKIIGVKTTTENVEKTVEKINNKSDIFNIEIHENEPMQKNSREQTEIKQLCDIAHEITGLKHQPVTKNGASDARFVTDNGGTGITFGPRGHNLHGKNEYADLKSIENYYKILKQFLNQ